jgi:hypothetical protein
MVLNRDGGVVQVTADQAEIQIAALRRSPV